MAAVATTNPNHLTESLKTILADFRAALYRHGHLHRAAMPLVSLVLQYLVRAIARFDRACQRGPIPPRKKPTQSEPTPATPPARVRKPKPFPSKFAWLLALLPPTPISGALAGGARQGLINLLAEPELIALLATNPSIGRIFRPLCHMFGIKAQPPLAKSPPRPQKPAKPLRPPYPPIPITIPPGTNPLALFFPKKYRP